jgi:hypothetical protein
LHGLDRGGRAQFGGVEGRAASTSGNSYTRNNYNGYGRASRSGAYAAGAAAGYAYGSSYASSDDGCTYVWRSTRYGTRRVLVCNGN